VTYDADVKAIFDASCVSCHGPSQAFAGIRLDGYANAFANRAAAVDSVVNDRMPFTPLSGSAKALLSAWLDAGAPQN
jgi:mono/diheme cytochrome c family protein